MVIKYYEPSCTCRTLRFPPCDWCTSDDNPLNQEEDPDPNQVMLDRDQEGTFSPRPVFSRVDMAKPTEAEHLFHALNITCALAHMPARGWLDYC